MQVPSDTGSKDGNGLSGGVTGAETHAPLTGSFIARASALLAGATLLSRLLGLGRDMLMAHFFGAGGQTDSFAFAIVVPELLRTLVISGAVASVFIPLITETQKSGKIQEVKRVAGFMLSFIALVGLLVVLAGETFAPQLVHASEFLNPARQPLDTEKFLLTVQLVRILLPIVVLVGLWGLMGGILNTFDNFHVPGLAPLAWNSTIIVILLVFGNRGYIQYLAWAYIAGHFIQMLVHLPSLFRIGVYPRMINWTDPVLGKFIRLAPAAVLAYAAPAVNAFIGQGIALTLGTSFASSLMYAFRVQQLPMSIFGVSVATALFPTLSRHSASGSTKELVDSLATGLRMTSLAVIPSVVFFLIMPHQVIEIIYQRGQFGLDDTSRVAAALYWYSWSILPMSLLLLTARTFFAEKDTRTPAIIGIATIVMYYILAIFLTNNFGFTGLPMSNSGVAWLALIASILILQSRFIKRDGNHSLTGSIGAIGPIQMIAAALVEAGILIGYSKGLGEVHGFVPLAGYLAGAMVLGAATYLGILKLTNNKDLTNTLNRFTRKSG